jgi:hypothetical protein
MLGLSLSKILVLIAVIIILWRGAKLLGFLKDRIASDPPRGPVPNQRARPREEPPHPSRAQDLFECPKCGMFVPNGTFCISKEQCRLRRA